VFAMLALGSAIGLIGGLAGERYLETLLFGVKTTDLAMLATPLLALSAAAVVAALPPILRAVHVDPATALRSE